MIIDVHTHYGVIPNGYRMTAKMQLNAMKRYRIDYALISNIECGIFHEGVLLNEKMLTIVRRHPTQLGALLWCCENLTLSQKRQFEEMLCRNRALVKGLKVHPDLAGRRPDDPCFSFFYHLAEQYGLPVLFHTKNNEFSPVSAAVNAAEKWKDVSFILGHMGLGSDGEEALHAFGTHPNLYGDTAWVEKETVQKAVVMGFADRMLFGTDSTIAGEDTYGKEIYREYLEAKEEYSRKLLFENAKKLFHLDEKKVGEEEIE